MSDNTGIEWTDATWNPVTGCTKVSPGCDHCYAEMFAERWRGIPGHHFQNGFDVTLRPERLDIPLRWRKPRRIFVNSMSDLFHDDIPDEYIARVFAVMATAYRHTFQVLTKRHARMRSLLTSGSFIELFDREFCAIPDWADRWPDLDYAPARHNWHLLTGPLSNVWLGVSVENQQWANIRIPALLDTPAAVRFLSCEPLLGPIDLLGPLGPQECADMGPVWTHEGVSNRTDYGTGVEYDCQHDIGIDWVIVGGESGPGARPMDPEWARWLRDQCQAVEISYLFKQWGSHDATGQPMSKHAAGRELDGRTWDEYPDSKPHAEVASS